MEERRRSGERRASGKVSLSTPDYVEQAVEPVRNRQRAGDVTLREYIEAVLNEHRRGLVVAEQEREKAARALADTLSRQIDQGDQALHDHIEQQLVQVKAALISADLLEQERIKSLERRLETTSAELTSRINAVELRAEEHITQLRREREIVTSAQQAAIAKAEVSTEQRFASVNEFRAQLADTISQFLPREVAEAQFIELRRTLHDLTEKVNKLI